MDIGDVIDQKYELIRLLGKGGMGAVYEGRHRGTGRRVAVKLITAAYLEPDDPRVKRFQREARAAGAIESQHIAQVLDCGDDAKTNTPYLVIEYLEGEDLQARIDKHGPLAPEVALRIVGQACVGLQKAHEAGVVHRDIKPANVFLARRDQGEVVVKLLDFGIAKFKTDQQLITQTSGGLTGTGSLVGSPLYMAPEQLRDAKDVDARTDVWSLGIVLYCALAGAPPLAGIDSFVDLLMAVGERDPDPVSAACPWVSEDVSALVAGAAKIRPDERFPSATAFLERIKAVAGPDLHLNEAMLAPFKGGSGTAARPARAHEVSTLSGSAAPARAAMDTAPGAVPVAPDRPSSPVTVQVRPSSPGGAPRITVTPAVGSDGLPNALSDTTADEMGNETTAPLIGALDRISSAGQRPSGVPQAPASMPALAPPGAAAAGTRGRGWLWGVLLGAGGLGALVILYIFLYIFYGTRGASEQGAVPTGTSAAVVSAAAAPAQSAATAPKPSTDRVMKLEILPVDAQVEVEGQPVVITGGSIEIQGALGAVRRVRVYKGAREVKTEVVITELGPRPAKIELK